MRKALIRNNLLLLILAMMLFLSVAFFTLYRMNLKSERAFMQSIFKEVETLYDYQDNTSVLYAYYLSNPDRRVTLIDPNFEVIFDTHDPQTVGDDKSNRPEVNNLGTVYRRYSDTIGTEMLYLAMAMDDGNILRVSIETNVQLSSYNEAILVMSLSAIGIILVSYYGLVKVNENLLKPWHKVQKSLNDLSLGQYQMMSLDSPYHEINEILMKTNDVNLQIAKQLHHLKNYKRQLNHMLNEIKQGVLLFNDQKELVYYNDDARQIFDLKEADLRHPTYQFIRELKLQEAIDEILDQGGHRSFDLEKENIIYEVNIFQIVKGDEDDVIANIMVTLRDVTNERQLEQTKKDFFAHASHELKSPLTAIKGFSELIYLQLIKDAQVEEVADKIMQQANHMDALVEDMLMLSRLENVKTIPNTKIPLDQVLKHTVDLLKPMADDKQITIKTDASPCEMIADHLDISKLFKNLIENAIKYSEKDKTVHILLTHDEAVIRLVVKDQGFGIEKAQQSRIFERFYRIDKGRLDGGTGLGLAIVKHIVIKYQGTIQLQSAVGQGTTITVEFPAKK